MVYFFILLFCELIAISLFYECYPSRGNSTTWRGIFLDTSRAARQNMNILPCDSNGSQQFNIFLMDMDTCDYIRPFNKAYFITCKYICCIKTVMNMTVYHTWNHVLLDNVSRIFFFKKTSIGIWFWRENFSRCFPESLPFHGAGGGGSSEGLISSLGILKSL